MATVATGLCRWLSRPAATADGPARQGVLAINGNAYRLCEQLGEGGAPVGWWLERADGSARYFVDTTFGADAGSWECTCPSCRWRRPANGCKHIASLHAALRHLEAPAAVAVSDVA